MTYRTFEMLQGMGMGQVVMPKPPKGKGAIPMPRVVSEFRESPVTEIHKQQVADLKASHRG